MRLGSGRLAEPTLVPSPGLGGGRSWNSSDYNEIDDFLVRMGRRPRPASDAASRDRPSGSKRKSSTTPGASAEAPLPSGADPSPSEGEKVAQSSQPMQTPAAAEVQQPMPPHAQAPISGLAETARLLPPDDVYRPGTKARRRRTDKVSRGKGRPKAAVRARVPSQKELVADPEGVGEASSPVGATATSESSAQQWSDPASLTAVGANTDHVGPATEATADIETASVPDPPAAPPEASAHLPLLDSEDAVSLSATAAGTAEERSAQADEGHHAERSDDKLPCAVMAHVTPVEGTDSTPDLPDTHPGAPLSESAHIRAKIDAVMAAPLVRDAVTPLPATTVRALLPRPSAQAAGHRARRLLLLAAAVCAMVSSVAAWLVRPEVLFGDHGLLAIAASRFDRANVAAMAPARSMPPAAGTPSLRAVDQPVESRSVDSLEVIAAGDALVASDAERPFDSAAQPSQVSATDAATNHESTAVSPPTTAGSPTAATPAPAFPSSDPGQSNVSERGRAGATASGPTDNLPSPGARPGAGPEAASGGAQSIGTTRVRVAAGGVSAEIVEAVPERSGAASVQGHAFVPPKPLAASSPLPEGLSADTGGAKGRVFLNVTVDVDGSTGLIEIVDAPQGDTTLSSAVVSALRQWKFRPAELDGEQVASRLLVVFEQR